MDLQCKVRWHKKEKGIIKPPNQLTELRLRLLNCFCWDISAPLRTELSGWLGSSNPKKSARREKNHCCTILLSTFSVWLREKYPRLALLCKTLVVLGIVCAVGGASFTDTKEHQYGWAPSSLCGMANFAPFLLLFLLLQLRNSFLLPFCTLERERRGRNVSLLLLLLFSSSFFFLAYHRRHHFA